MNIDIYGHKIGMQRLGMHNDEKKVVDLYIPKKCSATNKLLGPRDHTSVQISIADVDENGKAVGSNQTFNISGKVRAKGQSDACLNRLFNEKGFLSFAK